jgi:hypothetical protein
MRNALIAVLMLLCSMTAAARVDISIGINLPFYPQLTRIPGYPVYYAPEVSSNYFFYDGLYWVFDGDNWWVSSWYNGPWSLVDRFDVPVFLLRVPVRYYRHAPGYFYGWRASDAPRWGDHWGRSWEERRSGWDRWNRSSAPAPAPLPTYQRQYTGNQYPQPAQQAVIQTQNYRYQPQDTMARQHFQQLRSQAQSAPQQQPAVQQSQPVPQQRQPRQQEARQPQPVQPQPAQPQPALTNRAEALRMQQQQQQQQRIERQPQPQPQPQRVERQAQPQPQPAPQPQRVERAPQQPPAAREQPQAPEKGRGREENKGQDREDKGKGENR